MNNSSEEHIKTHGDRMRQERLEAHLKWVAERDKEERFEQEYLPKYYPDTFKVEYPDREVDFETYYRDQAPRNSGTYGFRISSMYLPYGIKKIDSWYGKQIRAGLPDHTPEQLEKMIRHNPHLHNVIKTNLIENLHNSNRRGAK